MDTTKIAQALSDPIRYKILMMLASIQTACCPVMSSDQTENAGMCNCEIMYELGMIQSRISYHMKELVETGLVNEEQHGRWKYYFFNRLKMMEYLTQLRQDLDLD